MTDWSGEIIAVDWGTSNRRAYLIDGDGRVLHQMEDTLGVATLERTQFPDAVAAIEETLGVWPMLLAGMVGSNRGWEEAPYVRCPASLRSLAGKLLRLDGGRKAIVPGLASIEGNRGDVMRGEEVQVFGLMASAQNVTVCHPGTHTKWVTTEPDRILGFRTIMTGEMFGLLRNHSILAPLFKGEAELGEPFLVGVDRGFEGAGLTSELFSLRANVLLSLMPEADALPFASGLLIGADLREGIGWSKASGGVVVLGRPSLTRLYAAAITRVGLAASEVDGAQAFVAGMHAIRSSLA